MTPVAPEQWVLTALTVLSCGFVQRSVGFGFDLLALPVLLIVDLDLPGTLVLRLITSSAQIALAVHQLRNAVHWRELGPVIGAPWSVDSPAGMIGPHDRT